MELSDKNDGIQFGIEEGHYYLGKKNAVFSKQHSCVTTYISRIFELRKCIFSAVVFFFQYNSVCTVILKFMIECKVPKHCECIYSCISFNRILLHMSTCLPSWAKVYRHMKATSQTSTQVWAMYFRVQHSGLDTRWYPLGSTDVTGPVTSKKHPWASVPFVFVQPGGTPVYVKMYTMQRFKMRNVCYKVCLFMHLLRFCVLR